MSLQQQPRRVEGKSSSRGQWIKSRVCVCISVRWKDRSSAAGRRLYCGIPSLKLIHISNELLARSGCCRWWKHGQLTKSEFFGFVDGLNRIERLIGETDHRDDDDYDEWRRTERSSIIINGEIFMPQVGWIWGKFKKSKKQKSSQRRRNQITLQSNWRIEIFD